MCPRLAIVVPAGPGDHAWRDLLPQLDAVGAQEIVLVLAKGEGGTAETLPANVRLALSAAGRARQLNAGAAESSADWLWFLHADSRIVPSTIDALRDFVEHEVPAIGYFDLRFQDDGPGLMFLNRFGAYLRSRWFGLPFGDQGLLMPRSVYHAVGGFDERIASGEDHAMVWAARFEDIPLLPLRAPIYTSARKYAHRGWWATTREHLRLTLAQAHAFSRQEPSP
jgi:GT2 family glycosyltransferase